MGFRPFQEKGMPLEKQLRNWTELNVKPYDRNAVDPYTRCRIILMNGVEVEGAMFSHQLARHADDLELVRSLAQTRRIEQQQQKAVNWLTPGDESDLEVTIGYEQVAVDLTAGFARHEKDPYVKAAFDFGLLEDFDHLYRYANLLEMTQGKKADAVTKQFTEITVGRPTIAEHRHPVDDVRRHYDRTRVDPTTQLHALILLAGEQQTMNFYMNIGNRPKEMIGRGLYLEIAQIEEQHVTHYESLLDPRATWFERLVLHEMAEAWLYHCYAMEETDPAIRKLWQTHLEMEIEHLNLARQLMQKHEKKDPAEIFPKEIPDMRIFESNIDYVREILSTQVAWNAHETEFLSPDRYPKDGRYKMYQDLVNRGGVPSETVIEQQIAKKGTDYRQELKGPHPVESLRQDRLRKAG